MQIEQIRDAILDLKQLSIVVLDQIRCDKSEKIGINAFQSSLLWFKVFYELLRRVTFKALDIFDSFLQKFLEKFLNEPVVRLAAKLEYVSHFLLDLLVLILLANLDHLDDWRVEMCLQKVVEHRPRLGCFQKDRQQFADLTLIDNIKKASFPHLRDDPLNGLSMLSLKPVAVVIWDYLTEELGHVFFVLLLALVGLRQFTAFCSNGFLDDFFHLGHPRFIFGVVLEDFKWFLIRIGFLFLILALYLIFKEIFQFFCSFKTLCNWLFMLCFQFLESCFFRIFT